MVTSHCRAHALGCGIQQLRHTSLAALWQVGSSRTRDQTRVTCPGRWIPTHSTTKEGPDLTFNSAFPGSGGSYDLTHGIEPGT